MTSLNLITRRDLETLQG